MMAPTLLNKLRDLVRGSLTVARAEVALNETMPALAASRVAVRPRLRVLFYPVRTQSWNVTSKICAINRYRPVTLPGGSYDLALHTGDSGPSSLSTDRPVLNGRCLSISKTHVAEVFGRVFGYSLAVDPTTYQGPIVEKSDENYRHDGRILDGPLDPSELRPGRVYQRLVDTEEDGQVTDLRAAIYGGRVVLVYVKRRPADDRFSNTNASVRFADPADVFSGLELGDLASFADMMGVDYAELDVLRDRDGRIYVVDVATTPAGPPNGLPDEEGARAMQTLAAAFEDLCRTVLQGD